MSQQYLHLELFTNLEFYMLDCQVVNKMLGQNSLTPITCKMVINPNPRGAQS